MHEGLLRYKKENKEELSVYKLAQKSGVCNSTLHHSLHTDRAWPALRWLAVMKALGLTETKGDTVVIHSKKLAKALAS